MATDLGERMVETCLVCIIAWDTSAEPQKCWQPEHPHALAVYSDWDKTGHGRAE